MCIDELSAISSILEANITIMKDMLDKPEILGLEEPQPKTDHEETQTKQSDSSGVNTGIGDGKDPFKSGTITERIHWALGLMKQNIKIYEALKADLQLALDTVSNEFCLSSTAARV